MTNHDESVKSQVNDVNEEEPFGSLSPIFAEPPITLSDLPTIPAVEPFEDEQSPERLKAIIRHMRKLSGRHEQSAVLEFVPRADGGKQFIVTFPEGDERAICRVFAQEVRREGVEDPAVCARLDAAYKRVQHAKRTVDAVEFTAATCGALAGDIIEAFTKLYEANQNGDALEAWNLVKRIHEQLEKPSLRPFLDFVESCRAERDMRTAQARMDALCVDRMHKAKEEGVDVEEVDEGGGDERNE